MRAFRHSYKANEHMKDDCRAPISQLMIADNHFDDESAFAIK